MEPPEQGERDEPDDASGAEERLRQHLRARLPDEEADALVDEVTGRADQDRADDAEEHEDEDAEDAEEADADDAPSADERGPARDGE